MSEHEVVEAKKIMVSAEQKALVKSIVFPGCTDNEMALYLFECERRGVHPLDRVIFPVSRNDAASGTKKITFQCGVDFFRAEAADTGEYDGQDEPIFGATNAAGYPEFATVAVYKKGIDRPITGTARWSEFFPGDKMGFMWKKMPFHMLSKCAEVLALRKAFPKRLSGLYIPEEMMSPDTGKAAVKAPQKKAAPESAPPETTGGPEPAGEQGIIVPVADVKMQTKTKGGDPMKNPKYYIHSTDDKIYSTFSESFAKEAREAQASGALVIINYTTDKWGNNITDLRPYGPAETREPGAEG